MSYSSDLQGLLKVKEH